MSLLNEMLKDLNQNKVRVNATPLFLPLHKESLVHKLPRLIPWLFVAFILSLLILLIVHGSRIHKKHESENAFPGFFPKHFVSLVEGAQEKPTLPQVTAPAEGLVPSAHLQYRKKTILPDQPQLPSFLAEIPELKVTDSADISLDSKIESAKAEPSLAISKTAASLTAKEWYDLHFNEALEAIEDGEEDHAIQLLSMVLAKFPGSIDARESLAAIYLSRADLKKATTVLDQGLKYEPDSEVLAKMKARILFEQDKVQQALQLLSPFKPDMRRDPDYYGLLAAILQSLGKEDEAGDIYKRLVEIEPGSGQYWLGYAIALEHKQAFQQAAKAYQQASLSYEAEPAVRIYAENRLKILQG